MTTQRILFVTPVMPQAEGNGLAMRAGLMLEALAQRFEVHLFVVPVAGGCEDPSEFARRHTARVGALPLKDCLDTHFALLSRILDPQVRMRMELVYPRPHLSRFCGPEAARRLKRWAAEAEISAVHVMRLYLAPLAEPFLRRPHDPASTASNEAAYGNVPDPGRPLCVLDLDDDEVCTRQRMARVAEQNGDTQTAEMETAEAAKYRRLQAQYFSRFDRVTVCSDEDAERLAGEFPQSRFMVVPNGYRLSNSTFPRAYSEDGPLRLLLVATLGCYANAEAAVFLCREVVPALRRLCGRQIQVDLVGGGAPEWALALGADPGVRLHGYVDNLSEFYASANVAVVPLRAGGGTRIKILEAFSYGVPVVSTSLGAEGIEAVAGEHLLLGDDPETFARACLKIKENSAFARALACRAAALLAEKYSAQRIYCSVAAVYG
jgi:glycosyltransferase involved in cell wall biosynthesis